MDSHSPIATVAQALRRAERILVITGAGLSADSGMPTYRGLGGLYNGRTEEGLPIEAALSGPMLRRDPALCWKYLAELGKACLAARPNAGHEAIAELQKHKPECWVLTQNIDGFHRQAGSPPERLIEIHGELAPLYCQSCGAESGGLEEHLHGQLPPRCAACGGVLRPPVVLFEEMLPEEAIDTLYRELRKGFDAVLVVGTTASFPYIVEPVLRTRQAGGFTAEVNPGVTDLSERVDVKMTGRALDIMPQVVSHIYR
ncbi:MULTISPECIES: NAD-dependent deacylase [Pseudomonas]|uniref:NAD-dependent deacylase n=1 Tax=Pseudomonas TaxID=286 RepID=UPI00053EEB54|nr:MULTISPECIES: NAD-dependent deacylase [Pseudomonas]ARC81016.1 NAD-dependent protein deacylase [Pseudomonas aeruginosa]EKV2937817.1 NAD-dependent deacylase [Pseudomonas aeruginosa]KSC68973.1 NAD-dependent protein deacylase [Pseudomonas aeruginosa]KSE30976.1 NAD-dependent protein deacylase [Pseudomonas aeruginosa]KSF90781.1 NAD-dependent protein deacylase [Pseudomonas aeruginosa]